MDESNTYTPSDLIYLYLDGEASSVQQSMLFGALARNSDLQAEFTEALRIGAAIERERSSTIPPPHLGEDLFRKAGFGSPEATTALTAPVVSGFFRRFFGNFGAPMLTALGSALLTALILTQSYDSRYDDLAGELQRMRNERSAGTGRMEQSEAPAQVEISDAGRDRRAGSALRQKEGTENITGNIPLSATSRISSSGAGSAERSRPIRSAVPPVPETDSRTDEGSGLEDRVSLMKTETASGILVEPVELRTERTADRESIPDAGLHIAGTPMEYSSPLSPAGGDATLYPFSVQLRGITDIGFFPARTVAQEPGPWFNNMSIGALYRLTENHAVGAEAGQEHFPLYRSTGTVVKLEPRLAWAGGVYRFETDPIEPLGTLRPFAQTVLGASAVGPIGRGIAGFTYTPDSRVDLSIGLEGTVLLYQLRGEWYSVRKTGLTYLMSVHF